MANVQDLVRKKSPRAPTISLDDAVERVLRIYDKERVHPAPADLVAQAMGYKDANNGRALGALASLRYYGLVDRVGEGKLAVSKDVEAFKYAPNNELRDAYLRKFLATPPLFAELLDGYSAGLPSDGTIRYDLIQRGFLPNSAEVIVIAFRRSVEFAKAFAQGHEFLADTGAPDRPDLAGTTPLASLPDLTDPDEAKAAQSVQPQIPTAPLSFPALPVLPALMPAAPQRVKPAGIYPEEHDRIPVRLSGGRRAWLLIPPILFEADKQRLKAQINFLLTEDE